MNLAPPVALRSLLAEDWPAVRAIYVDGIRSGRAKVRPGTARLVATTANHDEGDLPQRVETKVRERLWHVVVSMHRKWA